MTFKELLKEWRGYSKEMADRQAKAFKKAEVATQKMHKNYPDMPGYVLPMCSYEPNIEGFLTYLSEK